MASSINASTAGAGGVITTADNSGVLNLQSGGTTVATINSTGIVMASNTAPTFSAYGSATQSILNNTTTKLTLDVETFDTNSNFASNRFTPTISGYYQINGCSGTFGSSGLVFVSIYKNGGEYKRGSQVPLNTSGSLSSVADVVYFNGSTDYVELYITQLSGSTQNNTNGSALTYMSGCFLRSA